MRVPVGATIYLLVLAVTVGAASVTAAAGSGFADLLAKAKLDMGTEKGAAYDQVMGKQIESKQIAIVGSCVEAAGPGGPREFRAVIVVQQDGTVSEVALNPETEIAKCVRKALLQETFPAPPVAPFHDLMQLSFR
jgi:hypothetical protein